jgi:phosphohistidine swiveling domain-containing protein
MAHLQITGEFITNRARQLVIEEDWTHASRFVIDALVGISDEQALGVLKGTHRLTGIDPILYKEEDEAGRTATDELYGSVFDCRGTLLHNGRRYQPYSCVDSFGIEDASYQKPYDDTSLQNERDKRLPHVVWSAGQMTDEDGNRRAMFYADNPKRDIVFRLVRKDGSETFVLFEPAYDSCPPWMPCFRTPQEAFAAAEDTTPRDGHRQRFPKAETTRDVPCSEVSAAPKVAEAPVAADRNVDPADPEDAEEQMVWYEGPVVECPSVEDIENIRKQVIDFADNDSEYGWQTFTYVDPKTKQSCTLRAPGRAMVAYALSTTQASHLRPTYTPFSPHHLKMDHDNPYHSDAWLGCGLELGIVVYDRQDIRNAAFSELAYQIQRDLLKYRVHVLTSGGIKRCWGKVVTENDDIERVTAETILVVKSAGVENELAALRAGAVICETGGPLAHLVTVCRERSIPIVRLDKATQTYRSGMTLTLDLEKGEIDILPLHQPPFVA